jgi:hypothetical protein
MQCKHRSTAVYPNDVIVDGVVIVKAGTYHFACARSEHQDIFHETIRVSESEVVAPEQDEWAI